jgi:hypothetical protein
MGRNYGLPGETKEHSQGAIAGGNAFDKPPFVDPNFVPPPKKKKVLNF